MDCAACEEARQHAKAHGHRNWRTGFACYDCAAVNLDEWFAENGIVFDDLPAQPDLFEAHP